MEERIVAKNREMQNAEAFQCGVFGKICKNMHGRPGHPQKEDTRRVESF